MTTPAQQQARVTRAIRDYRRAVRDGNLAAMSSLNDAYETVYRRLQQELEDAIAGIQRAQAAGRAPNTYRLQRAVELARQAEQLLADVSTKIGQELPAQKRQAAQQAFAAAAGLLDGIMGPPPPDLPNPSSFMTVPRSAIETITASVNNGPVQELLNSYGEEAGKKAGKLLTGAVAAGQPPQAIAKQIRKELDIAQWQATRIARTEINRTFRESLRETWTENKHLTPKWIWRSGRSRNTCAMCWAMDGQEFDVDEPMGTHPQCQCCLVPKTIGWAELAASKGIAMPPGDWDIPAEPTGPEAFAALDPDTQRHILGPGKYAHYAAGNITLADLVHRRESDDWGVTRSEGSLTAALERSRKRNGGELPADITQERTGAQSARGGDDDRPVTVREATDEGAGEGIPDRPTNDPPMVDWEIVAQRKRLPADLQELIGAPGGVIRVSAGIDNKERYKHSDTAELYRDLDKVLESWEFMRHVPEERKWEIVQFITDAKGGDPWPLLTVIGLDQAGSYNLVSMHRRNRRQGAKVRANADGSWTQRK